MSLISGRAYSWTEKAFQKKLHGSQLIKILPGFSALLSKKKIKSTQYNMLVVGSGLLSRWLIIMGRIFFVVDT